MGFVYNNYKYKTWHIVNILNDNHSGLNLVKSQTVIIFTFQK